MVEPAWIMMGQWSSFNVVSFTDMSDGNLDWVAGTILNKTKATILHKNEQFTVWCIFINYKALWNLDELCHLAPLMLH